MPYKTEICNALSDEQCFSKHFFLDICQCVFKSSVFNISALQVQDIDPNIRYSKWVIF